MTERPTAAQTRRWPAVVWLLPVACAIYAIAIGRDANWDLLNYHYYTVHAWLTGRTSLDLAMGQLQTWFNPLLHLPLYIGMEHLPPRVYAAALGAVQGLNLILVWHLARRTWPAPSTLPSAGPVLVAVTAGCGAGFLTQLGTSFGDTLVSLPIIGALYLTVGGNGTPRTTSQFAAGLLGGIAIGLKPLAGIYALALAAAIATLPGALSTRTRRLLVLAVGGIAGVAISGGWWYWRIWQETGNPLFPYYNDIFQSPLYWNERFEFTYFLPKTWVETIAYPWIWLAHPKRVSEMRFIDLAIPGLMTLAVLAGAARLLGLRPQDGPRPEPAVRALVTFWTVGYVLWLTQSSVYRFAVVLEMTAPLLIVVLLSGWVPAARVRGRVIAVLALVSVVTVPANFGRFAFAAGYMVPTPVALEPSTMIVVAGWAPLSYMAKAFPAGTPLVRIQSNMHGFVDRPNGMDAEARRRVDQHDGPRQLLLAEAEWSIAEPLLDQNHYVVDRASCRMVDGTMAGGGGAGRLVLCPLDLGSSR